MAERWRYAGRKHPPYCTCANCRDDGPRPPHSQQSNQLRAVLEKWRSKNFDPHHILGVPPDSSRKLIVEAHRRWIIAYHPDKHNNDPLANELTKHLNASRDELLGKNLRGSRSKRDQRRNREAAQHRAREAERQRQDEERRQQREKAARTARRYAENRRRQQAQRQSDDFDWSEWVDQQNRQGWRTESAQEQTHNSLPWTIVALTLATLIAAYLILTITAPNAIDSLMEEWARLFDQALTR